MKKKAMKYKQLMEYVDKYGAIIDKLVIIRARVNREPHNISKTALNSLMEYKEQVDGLFDIKVELDHIVTAHEIHRVVGEL